MSHAVFQPIKGRTDEIMDFVLQAPEVRAHPSILYAVRLACEEVIVNIQHYAYTNDMNGYIVIGICSDANELHIEIRDGGKPFNPLERDNPDTGLDPTEREIGGLGIFLVRQVMNEVRYTFHEGENRLLLIKKIDT